MRKTNKEKISRQCARKKRYASGAELIGKSQLRWKLCRLVNGRFYSLFNVAFVYKDHELEHCRRTGLVLEYALGKKTVGTLGGIFAYDGLGSLWNDQSPW